MAIDVLVVGTGATAGWRAAVSELSDSIARSGARVRTLIARPSHGVRTLMLTDLAQARVLRRSAVRAIAECQPRSIVYCSVTAALLWPAPGAIWLDSLAAENRPGRHGVWQRRVEHRRLEQAPLVLTMSERSLEPLPGSRPEAIVVPVPVEGSGPLAESRDVDALAYAADPVKRRLDFVLDSWARARKPGETLVVAGIQSADAPDGVRFAGRLAPNEYRALLRRARLFVAAPTREDYGIAPLEALADGCMLVSTPSPGPYPALDLARALDPRLVGEDLAPAIRAALDTPVPGYADRADELLGPFRREAVDATIARRVLPRLLPGFTA
jgi:glycosyltransferase involved in cell wall biosynthesis